MRTNTSITVYNKYIDSSTRSERWQRFVIPDITWEDRKASNVLASGGQQAVDQATVFIPFARMSTYLDPIAWRALRAKTGRWTLQIGDLLVRESITDDLNSTFTVSDLKAKYDHVLIVSSIDYMNLGSTSMWHFKVGAK
jgi:hypothetical protein